MHTMLCPFCEHHVAKIEDGTCPKCGGKYSYTPPPDQEPFKPILPPDQERTSNGDKVFFYVILIILVLIVIFLLLIYKIGSNINIPPWVS